MEEISDINNIDANEATEAAFYEVSYHVVPTLSEEDAKAEITTLKELVSTHKGTILAEGQLQMFELAYDIAKTVKSVKTIYDRSYFGWIKFSCLPETIADIKTSLDNSASVLRYLIIRIEQEDIEPKVKEVKEKKAKIAADESTPVESELDKTIDQLVIS